MRISKRFAVAMLAVLMAGGAGSTLAQQTGPFTHLFVFGDSLSDSGNIFAATGGLIPGPPYFNGRFSNGPIWVEHLAPALGFPFDDATDFAFGGAESGAASPTDVLNQVGGFLTGGAANPTDALNLLGGFLSGFLAGSATDPTGVLNQLDGFLAGGAVDPTDVLNLLGGFLADGTADPTGVLNLLSGLLAGGSAVPAGALTVLWAGSNDVLHNAATTPPDVLIGTTVINLTTSVALLAGAGARTFLIPNLPQLGHTPRGAATGQAAQLNHLAGLLNSNLHSTMIGLQSGLGVQIMLMNVEGLFNDVLAAPALYGIANTATPCLSTTPPRRAHPTGACATAAATAATLFWDPLHPTATAHALLSAFATATLAQFQQPRNAAAASFLGPLMMDSHFKAMTERRITRRAAGDPATGAYVAYKYADGDRGGTPTLAPFNYDFHLVTLGADTPIGDHIVLGGAVTFVNGDARVGGGVSSVDFDSVIGSAYVGYHDGGLSVDLMGAFSGDDYDLTRETFFTPRPVAQGDTEGNSFLIALEAGYALDTGRLQVGPVAGIRYVDSDMDGFSESDAVMLNLIAEDRKIDGWIGTIGLQLTGRFGGEGAAITPYARMTYEAELDELAPQISLLTTTGQSITETAKPKHDDQVTAQAGLTYRLGSNVHATIAYQGTVVHGEEHGVAARLSYAF